MKDHIQLRIQSRGLFNSCLSSTTTKKLDHPNVYNKILLTYKFSDQNIKFHALHLNKRLRRGVQPMQPHNNTKIRSSKALNTYTCSTHEEMAFCGSLQGLTKLKSVWFLL